MVYNIYDMPWTYNNDGIEEWIDGPEIGRGTGEPERQDVSPAVREQAEREAEQGMEVVEIVAETRAKLAKMEKAVQRSETFAKWMDKRFLDPIISIVVPGVSDLGMSAAGLYIVAEAYNADVPKWILVKMLANLGIDALIGAIPVVGDIADFLYHANVRNAKLFREYYEKVKKEAGTKKGQKGGGGSTPEWIE